MWSGQKAKGNKLKDEIERRGWKEEKNKNDEEWEGHLSQIHWLQIENMICGSVDRINNRNQLPSVCVCVSIKCIRDIVLLSDLLYF